MAAEVDVIKTTDLGKVQSIDFVNRFGSNLSKLLEALNVTRKLPLSAGMLIKTYTGTIDLKDGTVAEGDIIPLSKVTTVDGPTHELTISKWRKAVTGEAIQRSGFEHALAETDAKMIREIQGGIRTDFFSFLDKGTGTAEGVGLQGALGQAWGQVQTLFEDDAAETIAFVNPLDVADYIANANVTMQTVFGMTFITGFTNTTVITNTSVPKGTMYATAPENIVLAYIPTTGTDLARTFNLTSDETGYVGITHYNTEQRLQTETLAISGILLFAERLDGVVKVDIQEAPIA